MNKNNHGLQQSAVNYLGDGSVVMALCGLDDNDNDSDTFRHSSASVSSFVSSSASLSMRKSGRKLRAIKLCFYASHGTLITMEREIISRAAAPVDPAAHTLFGVAAPLLQRASSAASSAASDHQEEGRRWPGAAEQSSGTMPAPTLFAFAGVVSDRVQRHLPTARAATAPHYAGAPRDGLPPPPSSSSTSGRQAQDSSAPPPDDAGGMNHSHRGNSPSRTGDDKDDGATGFIGRRPDHSTSFVAYLLCAELLRSSACVATLTGRLVAALQRSVDSQKLTSLARVQMLHDLHATQAGLMIMNDYVESDIIQRLVNFHATAPSSYSSNPPPSSSSSSSSSSPSSSSV